MIMEDRTELLKKVRRIEIKSRLGQELTPDEIKAIDPDDPMPGIEKSKRLADIIREKFKEVTSK